jgi:hypothetical protein
MQGCWSAPQGFRDVTIRVFDETPAGDGAVVAKLSSCSRLDVHCKVWAVGADDRVSLLHEIQLGHTAYTLVPFRCALTSRWMAAVALHQGNFKFRVRTFG